MSKQVFPAISKQVWLDKVIKDLKGRPLEDLNWVINEQLTIPPFYHPEDKIGKNTVNRGDKAQNDWLIGEDFNVEDATATNKRLLLALESGVNAPRLIFTEIPTVAQLTEVFRGVGLAYIETYLALNNTTAEPGEFYKNFVDYLKAQDYEPKKLKGAFLFQHVSDDLARNIADDLPLFRCLSVDGRNLSVHAADVVDVLAELLLGLDAWCQQISESLIPQIQLQLTVGKSYFLEIAKIRALHILWANLQEAYDVSPQPLSIDAYLSPDAYDDSDNTNMIRSMTMALSAVIGGVDRLTVLPANQKEDSFTTRIARNVQHLLQMESYMDRVIDPAKGSYYLEALTKKLVDLAWERLQNA